eukprot:189165-Pyramimonas_sp.AAC.1
MAWALAGYPRAMVQSFSEHAPGASSAPAPGIRHCIQRFGSPWNARPSNARSTEAESGGRVNHVEKQTRSCQLTRRQTFPRQP